MYPVRVKKSALIEVVKENLKNHVIDHEKLNLAYRTKVIERLEANLDQAKSGGKIIKALDLDAPISHEEDFIDAINMLNWSVDEDISLDEREFSKLVLNKWSWANQFMSSLGTYGIQGTQGVQGVVTMADLLVAGPSSLN